MDNKYGNNNNYNYNNNNNNNNNQNRSTGQIKMWNYLHYNNILYNVSV